jgi:hypothetical protein
MAAPKAKPAPQTAGVRVNPFIEVVLDRQVPKVHSMRYETENRPTPITNIYVNKDGLAALGRPPKVKVTVEGVWD